MGIYHVVANIEKKEYIDPGEIGGRAIKQGFVTGDVPRVVFNWMLYNWREPVTIVNDAGGNSYYEEIFDPERGWKNVTKEAVEDYNKMWQQKVEYIPTENEEQSQALTAAEKGPDDPDAY